MPRMWMWGVTTKDVSVGLHARELNRNKEVGRRKKRS